MSSADILTPAWTMQPVAALTKMSSNNSRGIKRASATVTTVTADFFIFTGNTQKKK